VDVLPLDCPWATSFESQGTASRTAVQGLDWHSDYILCRESLCANLVSVLMKGRNVSPAHAYICCTL
jgi:hypothetical protein